MDIMFCFILACLTIRDGLRYLYRYKYMNLTIYIYGEFSYFLYLIATIYAMITFNKPI